VSYDCGKCFDSDCRGNDGYTDPTCAQHSGSVKLPDDVQALRRERDEWHNAFSKLKQEKREWEKPLLDALRQIRDATGTSAEARGRARRAIDQWFISSP
jgi:hypothetical protein